MIVIHNRNSGTIWDHLFSVGVELIQSSVIRMIVKKRSRKYLHLHTTPDQQFISDLLKLGLQPDRLWWGPMTLFPRKAHFLIRQIELNPPTQLLEVGAGTSTAIFSALGYKYEFDVHTLENYKGTIEYVKCLLKDSPVRCRLTLHKCGFIRKRYPNGDPYRWYDANLSEIKHKFDFVFIDGPMGKLVGRNGAMPEIIPYLQKHHRIFLDDSQRKHEKKCIEEWRDHYPNIHVKKFPECFGISLLSIPLDSNQI